MHDVVSVTRTKAEAKASYDKMASGYDRHAGRFESRYTTEGLRLLRVRSGERVLELGYGTGANMVGIARSVGATGAVTGLDISDGMAQVARDRLEAAGLADRCDLQVGDASQLPFDDAAFDATFMSFTLELFDTPEIDGVLAEIRRVLRPGGRLGLVAMATSEKPGLMMRGYLASHRLVPDRVDCRPIPADEMMRSAGFTVADAERWSMWGLPVWLLVATSPGAPPVDPTAEDAPAEEAADAPAHAEDPDVALAPRKKKVVKKVVKRVVAKPLQTDDGSVAGTGEAGPDGIS
jgi:ubiquinone/menaquinone biosynthesis C-methylase UbiE